MLEHCEQILAAYRRLEYDMNLLKNEWTGDLRLGASTTISQYVLPPILARFTEKYPKVNVTLMDTNSRNIEQALQNHDIDLGLVEGVFRLPSLKYEPFLHDELVPVVGTQSKLAMKDEIGLDELQQLPLVLRERGSGTLDAIEMAFDEVGLKLSSMNVRLYLGGTESIKSFLRCSDSLGIVSLQAVAPELRRGDFKIIDIKDMQIKRHFCFVHLQGQEEPSSINFMRFVYQYLKERKTEGHWIGKMLVCKED